MTQRITRSAKRRTYDQGKSMVWLGNARTHGRACSDPISTDRSVAALNETEIATHTVSRTTPRFAIQLDVAGDLRPNVGITITASARAHLATTDAEVRITVPEVEAARTSAWGDGFRVTANTPISALSRTSGYLGQQETITQQGTLTIPVPGYYRVVASAKAGIADRLPRSEPPAEDFASKEIWLLITDEGGRVTDLFDTSVFPDSAVKQPGPFRYRSRMSQAQAEFRAMSPGSRTWEVLYYNQDASGYVPLVGAKVQGTEGLYGGTQTQIYDATDINGEFITGCDTQDFYVYEFEVKAENTFIRILPNTIVVSNTSAPAGCSAEQLIALSVPSHVFSNIRVAGVEAMYLFDESTTLIPVNVDPTGSSGSSSYHLQADSIVISHIWGDIASEIQAHEYGHAFHDNALGGIRDVPGICFSTHGTPVDTSQECAYSEGIAEYIAAVTRPTISIEYADFEARTDLMVNPNNYTADPVHPQQNGSRIEGAVAAFLLDLTDPANETHDAISYPGSYVADLIKTCKVNSLQANGIDHFIRCLEKQIDSNITNYFWPRNTTPTSYLESATEPGTWSLTNIRTLWLYNLYDQ